MSADEWISKPQKCGIFTQRNVIELLCKVKYVGKCMEVKTIIQCEVTQTQ